MAFFQSHSSNAQRPHAFVFPYPVQGHIQPFMRFSKLLASSYGFLISFFNSEENHTRLSAGAPNNEPDSTSPDIRMLFLPDVPPSALEMKEFSGTHIEVSHVHLSKTFLNTDPVALEALIRRQSPPVTCLIVDLLVPVIAPHLAQNLGLPMFILFTASAASLAMAIRSAEVGGDPKKMISIVGAPSLELKDVNPFMCICGRVASDYMSKLFTQPFREKLVKASDMILINTCEELEGSTLEYLRKQNKVCAIGPLLPEGGSLWAEDDTCLEWLDKQPVSSVLFVSFGSLAPLSATQLQELALGLEASEQRILWVTRPDLIHGKAPDLPSDFVERIKERVLIISWAPQLQVLCHPAVGGFLSHCGWNSTLESIAAGVPILTWPFFGDQMMNAKFVVQSWGIGLPLAEDGLISQALVEKRVRDLMEREIGKEVRERAHALKQAITSSLSKGGSSLNNLQHLFAHPSSMENCAGAMAEDEVVRRILGEMEGVLKQSGTAATLVAVEVAEAARRGAHLMLYGVGREGLMMKGLAMRLFHLGLRVSCVFDMTTPPISRDDLLLVSAGPGTFSTVEALASIARSLGARVLLLTAHPSGPASKLADVIVHVPAQTMATDGTASSSLLPMGSLYEGALFFLFEIVVLKLRDALEVSPDDMRARHTNME